MRQLLAGLSREHRRGMSPCLGVRQVPRGFARGAPRLVPALVLSRL